MITTIQFAPHWRAGVPMPWLEHALWLVRGTAHWAIGALALGLALVVLEHRARDSIPSAVGYAMAIGAGACCGAVLLILHLKFVDTAMPLVSIGVGVEWQEAFLYELWTLLFWGCLAAALHASSMRFQRSTQAFRRGELARLRSEQRLAQVRLHAVHAQVEPRFLLASLSTVEQLYANDLAAADRVLEALIGFLRRAVPAMRATTSTVGEECRLVQAYVRAVCASSGIGRDAKSDVDVDVDRVPMASGTLLPLAHHVLAAAPTSADGRAFTIGACHDGVDVRIEISMPADSKRVDSRWIAESRNLERRVGQSGIVDARVTVSVDEAPTAIAQLTFRPEIDVRYPDTAALHPAGAGS